MEEDIRFQCSRIDCIYNDRNGKCTMFDDLFGPDNVDECGNYFKL